MASNRQPFLNFGLGETADMLRDEVAAFAASEIAPRAGNVDTARVAVLACRTGVG